MNMAGRSVGTWAVIAVVSYRERCKSLAFRKGELVLKHALALPLFALVALCGLSVPAKAQISISGTVSGDGVFTPISPNVVHQVVTGEGDDTRYGSFTGQ